MTEATLPDTSTPAGPFHPSRAFYRTVVLVVVGLLTYGSYFAYDSIGAIAPTLIKAWHTGQDGIGMMYTIYSIAAILSVFVGGVLSDRIGTRAATILFASLIVVGAAIVAGATSVSMALVGRFLFGAGSESLVVVQSAILARWFHGKALALAFGVTLALSRLGTLFSFNTMSLLSGRFGWRSALWWAAALCAASLACGVVYFLLDRKGEKALGLAEAGAGDKIVLSDVRKFGASYWYVVALCVTFYSAIFPFTALSTDFFHEKWGLPMTVDEGSTGFLYAAVKDFLHMFSTAPGTTSIIIFASMCFAPFAGGLVDKVGRRGSLMLAGALLMIPCYLVMGFTTFPPRFPMILLGAAFVLVPAAMWPAVPLIVDKARVGTAFGLMTTIQNVGLALFPWLNGKLRVMTHSYESSMVMFASLGAAGFVFALLLLRADARSGHVLERAGG